MTTKIPLIFLALFGAITTTFAQGDAFLYQGRLDQNGAPATGLYDMRFTIWNSIVGPGIIAGPIVRTNIVATNGVFGVSLNFGPSVFTGEPRWLEIDVRTNITGTYETLSPRQEVLPTPYAMHAATAGSVGPGGVVTSLNNLKDDVTLAAGANVTITPNGNILTLAAAGAGGSGIWLVNNTNTYYNAGFVGIGTASPTTALDVRGHLTLDPGTGNAALMTGTGFAEYNRYLALFNSLEYTSASGLKVGGILCSDSYDYANPGKNDLVVKGQISYGGFLNKLDVADNFYSIIRAADLMLGHSSRRGSPGRALVDLGDRLVVNFANDWGFTVIGGSLTEVRALRITGGADIAEPFPMDAGIEKGSVMVIDSTNAGRLALSTRAYDKRVAGIISGANGVNPGIALKQEGILDQGENVALSGRVYVLADASNGPIEPGDLLTTSDTPGHAMKVTDHAKAQGAILGKAMGALRQGKGMVLVLVTLQ